MDFRTLTTKEKALAINLDNKIYGSFAEIGAGQETAANFFKAGGASGTIAKTMSAYDMAFSDAIYGPEESGRYVCQPRLIKMLRREYSLLEERLPKRAPHTRFFSFANTVESLNYRRTNQGQGWLGTIFQMNPMSPPNECIIHVQMHDNEAILQQQALGIIGVNLIYACYFLNDKPEEFLNSLMDGLERVRIEIDFIELTGPDFKHVDNRLLSLKLVKNGLTSAAMFGSDGSVLLPADVLYRKNILVLRGRFRPPTHVNMDMLSSGHRLFLEESDVEQDKVLVLTELTLSNLFSTQDKGMIDEQDFLDRVDILCSLGQTVMISDYQEYFKLVSFLSKYNRNKKIGLILGVNNLLSIFDERYYKFLNGGILEAFGILFGRNVKMYVYPSLDSYTAELQTSKSLQLAPNLIDLFEYLQVNNKIADIYGVNEENLHIISDNVLAMINSGEEGWEYFVPELVAKAIKENYLFHYKGNNEATATA